MGQRTVEFYSDGNLLDAFVITLPDDAVWDGAYLEAAKQQAILQYGETIAQDGKYRVAVGVSAYGNNLQDHP